MPQSVLVCLSGGVDSAVAALLLREQGFDVVGITFWFWSFDPARAFAGASKCCSLDLAALAARELDIPHETVDASETFRRLVVDDFIARRRRGETPNPCGRCNALVRFGLALEYADRLGCDYIATGHHARLRDEDGMRVLVRGRDARKDQTYFLYGLRQETLARLLLPIGHLGKDEVFARARAAGLTAAALPESQDLCFAEDGDVSFLFAEQDLAPGPILDLAGREIGRHEGLPRYTIGQRRGLGIAAPHPLYVLDIDPEANALLVGDERHLFDTSLVAREARTPSAALPSHPCPLDVKIRYRTPANAATVTRDGADVFRVTFREPQRAITPGQLAVLYDKERLVGGGVIARPSRRATQREVP